MLITCGVILLTLLQALLLPSVVRFARLPVDTSVDEEVQYADEYTLDAAIEALDTTASELGSDEMVVERVRRELDKQRTLVAAAGAEGDPAVQHDDQYTSLYSPSSAGGVRHSSSSATSSASTTSCCVGCRLASTSTRCGCWERTPSSEGKGRAYDGWTRLATKEQTLRGLAQPSIALSRGA